MYFIKNLVINQKEKARQRSEDMASVAKRRVSSLALGRKQLSVESNLLGRSVFGDDYQARNESTRWQVGVLANYAVFLEQRGGGQACGQPHSLRVPFDENGTTLVVQYHGALLRLIGNDERNGHHDVPTEHDDEKPRCWILQTVFHCDHFPFLVLKCATKSLLLTWLSHYKKHSIFCFLRQAQTKISISAVSVA